MCLLAHRQFSTSFTHSEALPANAKKVDTQTPAALLRRGSRRPHPQTQSQKRVNKKTWRKKLHTHTRKHTLTASVHTLPLPVANEVRQPITEFVYESPGKSNTTKMLKAAQQKKERRSFCAIFPQHQMAVARASALSLSLTHTQTHVLRLLRALSLSVSLPHTLSLAC